MLRERPGNGDGGCGAKVEVPRVVKQSHMTRSHVSDPSNAALTSLRAPRRAATVSAIHHLSQDITPSSTQQIVRLVYELPE